MILRQATILYKGYDPEDLKLHSNKRICVSCDNCGRVRWIKYQAYNNAKYPNLCKSCLTKGENNPMYGLRDKNNPRFGMKHSNETKQKISESHKGKGHKQTEKTKKKISKSRKGKLPWNKGIPMESEQKIKIGKARVGRFTGKNSPNYGIYRSEEYRINQSCTQQGIDRDKWDGFANESPYCSKFNESCRESNRGKYNRCCFICGKNEEENLTKNGICRKLSVHHIDMNKQQGCDENKWLLIPVCLQCHTKLHSKLWEARIKYLLK